MDDAISRKGTSAWLENMGYSYPAKVIMDEKRFPSVLGTNLAEVGTDLISRQDAIEVVQNRHMMLSKEKVLLINDLEKLPSAQPEIIRCKDCKHYKYGICKKAGLCVNKSPNGFCDWGEVTE